VTLTVCCVLTHDQSRANYHGANCTFSREYADKLRSAVARHLTIPHVFRCLTDRPERDYDIPLRQVWPFTGPTLYLDLDTLVLGDITWMVKPGRPFAAWWFNLKPSGVDHWCSAFQAWNGDHSFLTRVFRANAREAMSAHKSHAAGKGDQGLVAALMKLHDRPIADIAEGHGGEIGTLGRPGRSLVYLSGSRKPHLLREHALVREHWVE
jgi:hypothetical protein